MIKSGFETEERIYMIFFSIMILSIDDGTSRLDRGHDHDRDAKFYPKQLNEVE